MELAASDELYRNPLHPYTRALLSAVPMPDPDRQHERIILQGDVPTPINPPSGCPFHTRCWLAEPRCSAERPEYRNLGGEHWVACHLVDGATRTLRKDGQVLLPVASVQSAPGATEVASVAPAQAVDPKLLETGDEPVEVADELVESGDEPTEAELAEAEAALAADADPDATLGPEPDAIDIDDLESTLDPTIDPDGAPKQP